MQSHVLSMLSSDKPGVFPSQKYFSEKEATPKQLLVLFAWFVDSKQIDSEMLVSIFSIMEDKGINSLSQRQLRVVLNNVVATYNRNLSSATDLYRFPTLEQYKEIKERYSFLKKF